MSSAIVFAFFAITMAAPAGAESIDPESLPWNPAVWTVATTSRAEDGKSQVIKSRYWLKGKRLRYESYEGDFNGTKLAAAYYDYETKTVIAWDPAKNVYTRGVLDVTRRRPRDEGWQQAGNEKIAGLSCQVFVQERAKMLPSGKKRAGEAREWRHGRFVAKRSVLVERSSVQMLGMVLPVAAQTQTTELQEIKKMPVTDADVTPPVEARIVDAAAAK